MPCAAPPLTGGASILRQDQARRPPHGACGDRGGGTAYHTLPHTLTLTRVSHTPLTRRGRQGGRCQGGHGPLTHPSHTHTLSPLTRRCQGVGVRHRREGVLHFLFAGEAVRGGHGRYTSRGVSHTPSHTPHRGGRWGVVGVSASHRRGLALFPFFPFSFLSDIKCPPALLQGGGNLFCRDWLSGSR